MVTTPKPLTVTDAAVDFFRSLDHRTQKWRQRANCRDLPAERIAPVFFPVSEHPSHRLLKGELDEARELCRHCPVQQQCLDDAILQERDRPSGFRGGKTNTERKWIFYKRKWKGLVPENKSINQLIQTRKKRTK